MGYVEQFDIHSPNLTVGESLQFAGALRLERSIPIAKKMEFVDDMMEIVELTPVKGLVVGTPGETGLSHEQRKRLTIAVELCANPSVIFMDEPTTGLDARAAAIIAVRVIIINIADVLLCCYRDSHALHKHSDHAPLVLHTTGPFCPMVCPPPPITARPNNSASCATSSTAAARSPAPSISPRPKSSSALTSCS